MRRSSSISLLAGFTAGLVLLLSVVASAFAAAPVHLHPRSHTRASKPAKKTAETVSHTGRRSSRSAARQSSYASESGRGLRSEARARVVRRSVSRRRSRSGALELRPVRLNIPAPLRGSHESLVHQNEMAEAEGLERILDDADLEDRIAQGSLVPVPVSSSLQVNSDLPENRRYCRPWTAEFLKDFARAHAAKFAGRSLEVTSAVRTVAFQRQLRLVNGNAAAADGDIASPHLTGGAVDIAKQGLSAREIGWIRSWLIPLEQQGKIDVEEEFRQSCFHISVYKSYVDPKSPAHSPRVTPLESATILGPDGR